MIPACNKVSKTPPPAKINPNLNSLALAGNEREPIQESPPIDQ